MAKKTLMSDIASDVREIKESKSKFGTKLPGNGNKAQELTLKELSYEQMIMGSIASLVWGVKNINKDTQVKTLLGRNNIFDIVKNIQTEIPTSFDNFYKKLDELITKLSNNIANNLTQFSNLLIIPKFDELIKAVEKSYKEKGSLKDSTTKILIDLKAADTIEQILKDFDALDGIVIFDNDNVNRVQDLLDRLDKLSKEDIYLVINTNLYDTVKELKELKIDIYDPASLDNIKTEIENLKSEQINLFNLDDLNEAKNIFESIQKIQMTADTENILMGIHKFLDAIENSKFDEVKNKETISKLTAFFTGQKGSVENLLESIGKIKVDLDKDKFETLSKAFEIVNIASQLMEGHDTKINTKFFRDLNTVLIGDNYIKGLIENLEKLNVDIGKNTRQNIQTVDDFITTVSNLGNLGFFKLIKSKLNIKLIRNFLLKDITALIGDVDGFKSIRKDLSKSFESLDYLFDTISKLGELNIKHKSRMRRNLLFIEEFLVNDLKSIIEKQLPELASETKEAFESINSINTVIDSVLKFGELDEDKLDKLSESTFNLELFIKDDLKSLLNYIGNKLFKDNTSEQVLNNIINVNEAIEHINELNEKLPSLMYLAKIKLKVLGLYLEGTLIKNVFDILHIISNILNDEDKRFLSSKFDGTLQSIIDINGVLSLINTKQGIKDILSLDEELAYMYWCMNYVKEIANSYRKEYKFDEFKKTIQNINSVVESIKVKKEDTNKIKALISLLSTMYTLGQYASNKTTFDTEKFNEATNAIINNAVPFIEEFKKDGKLDKALQVMITIDDKKLEKFDQVIKFIKKFDELSKIAVLSKLSNLGLKGISEEADYIKTIIEKFASIDENKIKKAKESLSLFTKLVVISAGILLLGSMIMKAVSILDLFAFTITLGTFLGAICFIFSKFKDGFKDAMKGAQDAALLVVAAGTILALGSLIISLIQPANLILFSFILGVFLAGICYIFTEFLEDSLKEALNGAQDAALLVVAAGTILALGSLVTKFVNWQDLGLFTVMLGLFLGGICLIFNKLLGDSLKEALDGAQDAALLIVASGTILAYGSLVTKFVNWQDLGLFTVMLGVFIFAVTKTYALFSKMFEHAMKGAKEFGILIAFSGLTLILAGLLANKLDLGSLAWFTLILGVFIFAVTGTYALFSKNFKRAMKGAKEFGLLIAISAAVLIIGTLAVQKWIDIPSLITFTICLAGFVFAVVGVFGFASKFIKKSLATALAISLLTVICAGTLLLGAKFIQDNPGIIDSLLWFTGITIVYVAAMGVIMWLLGKIGFGALLKGILAIAAIGVITYGMVYVFNEAWNAFKDINWDKLIDGFINAGKVMGAIGLVMVAIGALTSIPVVGQFLLGAAAIGAGIIAALEALIWGMAKCMIAAASAIKSFEGINEEKVKAVIKPFGTFITEAAGALTSLRIKQILKIKASVSSIQEMGEALSVIAKSIQEFANLKIPVYDENGKISGYLNFNQEWLGLAAENIKEIILCIGTAIIDTYKHAQEMGVGDIFDTGWFSKDTPFSRVAKSMKNVGPMLSSIADAIQDWAYLRVPVYNSQTGKQTGYKQLKDTELTNAANNIQSVLITIGAAIIGTYKYTQSDKDLKDIFESSSWFGSSPFAKVTKAMKTMGPMLESIADGIQSWADLKVPLYDSNGKVKGYKQLKDKELTDAGESIQKVLIAIGQALITTVEGHTEIFGGDDMIHNSPAVSAAKAMKIMGETLNLTAKSVASYATGEFPIFDKNGKIIKTLTIKDKDYTKAEKGIEKILTCIGRSMLNIFKNPKNKELFQGTSSNSPALMAAKSVNEMSKALNASIAAIKQLSELKLDDLHKALNPNCKTRDNIYWRIKDLLNFTIDIYKLFAKPNGEEYGEGGGFLGFGTHDQNFAEFLNEHNPEIKEAGNSITDFTNLLSIIITNFAKMGKMFDKSLKDIAVFGIIVPYVSITMTSINNIIKLLTSDNLINLFKSINDKQNLIIKGENSTFAALNTMLVHMVDTKSLFESLGGFDLNKMIAIIQSFNNCVLELQKIGKPNENEQISFGLKFTTNSDELIKEINSYMRVIKLYVAISEYAKNVGEEGYNVLRDGILKVYAATQQIEDNGIFKQHVKQLEDYVEAINSIKLNHLGGLKGLVDSMNELSQRLGNLDNLTDAIGNKLSQVLYELVLQLRKAEATIHNAHELQEKRKKLMDESIEKIHSIMDHHMIVEISQQKEEDTSSTPPGKIGGNPIDDKSPQGTDPTPPTSTASKSNPEETTAAQGTGKSRVSNQPDAAQLKDVLTFGKFKDYMEKQYLNKIRNSG